MFSARCVLLLLIPIVLSACGDNLIPSGEDKRPTIQAGSTGPSVNQIAADFSVQDTNGNTVTLSSALAGKKGVVLYFTMWCSICDAEASSIQALIQANPNVGFYLVDYVSGSVFDAKIAESGAGYAGSGFITLADVNHQLQNNLQGNMGTTVVIDSTGIIRMNEPFDTAGPRLVTILSALP